MGSIIAAGTSILINADISTTADLTLIANDLLANGVIDRFRDAGNAVIQMADTTSITADNLTIDLRGGTGLTHNTAGDLTLASLTVTNSATIDSVNLSGSSITADNKTVAATYTLTDGTDGGLAANYSRLARENLFADITALGLTVGSVSVDASKVYDGNTTAHNPAVNFSNAIAGDSVLATITGSDYDNPNVGTNKTVIIAYNSILTGADAGNYTLTGGSDTTTADITAATTIDAGTILNIINPQERVSGTVSSEMLPFIDVLKATRSIFEPIIQISDLNALLGGDASANYILLQEALILLR